MRLSHRLISRLFEVLGSLKENTLNLAYRLIVRAQPDVVEYHGISLPLGADVVTWRIRTAIARNQYEIGEKKLLDTYLDPESPLIEIGGGIGFIAAYSDRLLADGTPHIVVEAHDLLLPVLEETRRLNDANFTIVHSAYAPGRTTTNLFTRRHFWSSSTRSQTGESLEVPATSVQAIAKEHGLNEFSLVVDIEGAEIDLERELPFLERSCRYLFIEYHDTKAEHSSLAPEVRQVRRSFDESSLEVVWSDRSKSVYRHPSLADDEAER